MNFYYNNTTKNNFNAENVPQTVSSLKFTFNYLNKFSQLPRLNFPTPPPLLLLLLHWYNDNIASIVLRAINPRV